jgi:hypothetical protein
MTPALRGTARDIVREAVEEFDEALSKAADAQPPPGASMPTLEPFRRGLPGDRALCQNAAPAAGYRARQAKADPRQMRLITAQGLTIDSRIAFESHVST